MALCTSTRLWSGVLVDREEFPNSFFLLLDRQRFVQRSRNETQSLASALCKPKVKGSTSFRIMEGRRGPVLSRRLEFHLYICLLSP